MKIHSGIHYSDIDDDRIQMMMRKWGFINFMSRNGSEVMGIPFQPPTNIKRDYDCFWGYVDEYGRGISKDIEVIEDGKKYKVSMVHIPTYSTGVTKEDMEYFWNWDTDKKMYR